MPYDNIDLPERVEKQRVVKKEFDLETADLTLMFHHNKKEKNVNKKRG